MRFKKDDDGKLVLDESGDPIAITESGEVIPLDKVVSLGKHARVEGERDEYKGQVEKLQAQISDLSKVSGDKEALEKQLADIKAAADADRAELQAKAAARDKEYALNETLLGAGVPKERLKAAKALVDPASLTVDGEKLTGLDLESFRKDNAYLFAPQETYSTGLPPRGASGVSYDDIEKMSVDEYAEARKSGKI